MENDVAFVQLLFTLNDGTHISVETGITFGNTKLVALYNSQEQSITHPDGQLAQNILIGELTYSLEKIFSLKVKGVYLISFVYGTHRMDVEQLPEGCVLSAVFPINYNKPTYSFWLKKDANVKQVS